MTIIIRVACQEIVFYLGVSSFILVDFLSPTPIPLVMPLPPFLIVPFQYHLRSALLLCLRTGLVFMAPGAHRPCVASWTSLIFTPT